LYGIDGHLKTQIDPADFASVAFDDRSILFPMDLDGKVAYGQVIISLEEFSIQ